VALRNLMKSRLIALTLLVALAGSACATQPASEIVTSAQGDAEPTPEDVRPAPSDGEPGAREGEQPQPIPGPTPDRVESESGLAEAPQIGSDVLPDGSKIPCYDVAPNVDDVLPEEMDHAFLIELQRENVQWWIEVKAPEFSKASGADSLQASYLVDVSDAAVTYADKADRATPAPTRILAGDAIYFASTVDADGSLLLGVDTTGEAISVAIASEDHTWLQVRDCGGYNPVFVLSPALADADRADGLASANRAYSWLAGYVDGEELDERIAAGLLIRLGGRTGAISEPEVTWDELDPLTRHVGDAPSSIRESLVDYVLLLEVPKAWIGRDDALLCTRVDIGWNTCVALSAMSVEDFESVGAIPLEGLRKPGTPVEVMLLDPSADTTAPSQSVGLVQAKEFGEDTVSVRSVLDTTGSPSDALFGRTSVSLAIDN